MEVEPLHTTDLTVPAPAKRRIVSGHRQPHQLSYLSATHATEIVPTAVLSSAGIVNASQLKE